MATYYNLYTEIKVDGKWYCINNKIKNIDRKNMDYQLHIGQDHIVILRKLMIS